jgi:nitrate reductase alpha subunit
VHELIPWRTLTGRQQFYMDHPWMTAFGEGLIQLPAAGRHQDHAGIVNIKPNGKPRSC